MYVAVRSGPPVSPLCLFAALRPLWLVNDDVLSQQTISLLNTSFSLLSLHPTRTQVIIIPLSLSIRFAWSHPASQFGKRVSTLCRKCNGTNVARINVRTNVGTRGRSLSGYFPRDAHLWSRNIVSDDYTVYIEINRIKLQVCFNYFNIYFLLMSFNF